MFFKPKQSDYDYVSASEVGHHAFCPESFRLSQLDTPRGREAERHMHAGRISHEQWADSEKQKPLLPLVIALILMAYVFYLIWLKG